MSQDRTEGENSKKASYGEADYLLAKGLSPQAVIQNKSDKCINTCGV